MNKLQYYTPSDTELPDGYVVARKCYNCRYQYGGCCTYRAPKPNITVTFEELQVWANARKVDPDGWCLKHEYMQRES